jgi:hypothetical protein
MACKSIRRRHRRAEVRAQRTSVQAGPRRPVDAGDSVSMLVLGLLLVVAGLGAFDRSRSR